MSNEDNIFARLYLFTMIAIKWVQMKTVNFKRDRERKREKDKKPGKKHCGFDALD